MIFLLLLIAFILYIVYKYWHFRTHYPIGPWPFPLVGNSIALRKADKWENVFLQWKNQYGPIYTFVSGVMPIVTVNDYDTIIEMFVKDGDSYADRPYLEVFTQLTRGGNYGIVATSGPLWQEQRRFALKVLKDFGLGKNQMQDLIIEELQAMLDRINKDIASGVDEHDFHKHTDLAVGSIINNLCCGYRFTQSPEKEAEFYKLKQIVSDMMKAFSDPFVGLCLFFAIFRKLPPFKTKFFKAIDYFNQIFAFLDANIEKHQKENDYHTLSEARDFIDAFLMEKTKLDEKGEEHYFSHGQLRNTLVDIWFAGQETTTHTLTWSIAFMITNPEVQQKMQEELDRVISSDRLIKVADKPDLPYCNAVVMETQRVANIISLNTLRTTSREVNIAGYVIPKGTVVVPQISVLMADPKIFPEPSRFNPSRFIDENGNFKPAPEVMPFSVGKRQCPGEGLAKMELFLFLANLFNQYKFSAGDTPPNLKKEFNGISMGTQLYTCHVEPRFK